MNEYLELIEPYLLDDPIHSWTYIHHRIFGPILDEMLRFINEPAHL